VKSLAAVAGRQRVTTNRLRIEPGEERRPARPATGRVRGLREPQAPARQPIKVRRVDLAAIRAEIGEAEIVGQDHKDVRSGRVGEDWPHA
jgi:cell division protein FtsN